VRLLRLKPGAPQPQAVTQIEMEVERSKPWSIRFAGAFGFETIEGTSYVAMNDRWIHAAGAARAPPGSAGEVRRSCARPPRARTQRGRRRSAFRAAPGAVSFSVGHRPGAVLRTQVNAWPRLTVKLNPLGITNELAQSDMVRRAGVAGAGARGRAVRLRRCRCRRSRRSCRDARRDGARDGRQFRVRATPLAALQEATRCRRARSGEGVPERGGFHRRRSLADLETKRRAASQVMRPAASAPRAKTPSRLPPRKRIPIFAALAAVVAHFRIAWFWPREKAPDPGPRPSIDAESPT
jgi:hypothetical protein